MHWCVPSWILACHSASDVISQIRCHPDGPLSQVARLPSRSQDVCPARPSGEQREHTILWSVTVGFGIQGGSRLCRCALIPTVNAVWQLGHVVVASSAICSRFCAVRRAKVAVLLCSSAIPLIIQVTDGLSRTPGHGVLLTSSRSCLSQRWA